MLQIKDIHKEYRTGDLVQKALDGVSMNLRDNEFVAILGPSGSGKTTLLNVIGGLDRYDSGDLVINGVSTKKYKDRDWDSYRNHTIGFVFQSYNLIPHQTILSNVELALTISGISGEERKKRAADALTQVGLGDQLHKKPSQLSGGQMQRVAIARALVNNPDILLADEPTGALDSATSVQIMDLLKEVARDHLVVMVTHNPELANQYATRIIELRDGKITSDSMPLAVDVADETPAVHRNFGKASMNFGTALSLSFNNLKTKLARTLLVAFAGSIGIIGIAMILSLSSGVQDYIDGIEEDTIREYPLTVDSTSFDLSSMLTSTGMGSMSGSDSSSGGGESAEITEMKTITSMFSMLESNDLKSLKKYIDSGKSHIEKYSRAIEYTYNVTPQIYRKVGTEYRQVNPDQTRQKMGISYNTSSTYSSMVSSDVFHALPADDTLYRDEYDVKAGRWPQKYNECVVVLSTSGTVSDLALYAMGLKDMDELDDMLSDLAKGENVPADDEEPETFHYKDCLGIRFKLVASSQYYEYDSGQGVWVNHSDDTDYVNEIAADGEDMKIVGVVQPKEDVDFTTLIGDIYYPEELTQHLMELGADSEVVKAQKEDKKTNVLTGKPFGEDSDGVDFENLFQIDTDAFSKAFQFDFSSIRSAMKNPSPNMDLSGLIDPDDVSKLLPQVTTSDITNLIRNSNITFTEANMQNLFETLLQNFLTWSASNGSDYSKLQEAFQSYLASDAARQILSKDLQDIITSQIGDVASTESLQEMVEDIFADFPEFLESQEDPTNVSGAVQKYLASDAVRAKIAAKNSEITEKISNIQITDAQAQQIANDLLAGYSSYASDNDYPDVNNLPSDFTKYLQTDDAQTLIASTVAQSVDTSGLEKNLASAVNSYSSEAVAGLAEKIVSAMMTSYMSSMGSGIDLSNLFSIDTDALANAFSMNMDEEDLEALMTSLMGTTANTYEGNLASFGYADPAEPVEIAIYAKDFDSKAKIKDLLDDYNEKMRDAGEEDKAVTYNDLAGALMSSVTKIIDAISYILIAFVSISLVVSSIMIGVITYISVLERRKEIGILRAIGASKHNIAEVFNAETFIIGALAGLFGVGITELLLIPTNMIIRHVTDVPMTAFLPLPAAGLLILLSIGLTLLGGLIPSRKAAKSDPVTALRVD